MGKAEIVLDKGEGLYTVRILHDTERATEELSMLSARIPEVENLVLEYEWDYGTARSSYDTCLLVLSRMTSAYYGGFPYNDKDVTPGMLSAKQADCDARYREFAALKAKYLSAKLKLVSLEKRKEYVENHIPENEQTDAWCADYSEGLSGEVGTVEPGGDTSETAILQPGYEGAAAYDEDRDGKRTPPVSQSAAGVFYNLAMMPGWRKWMPTYRLGEMTAKSGNVCSVSLDAVEHEQLFPGNETFQCNQSSTLENVPIEYMDCNGFAFEVGDRVLVKFEGREWDSPKVIGFEDHPVPCRSVLYVTGDLRPGYGYGSTVRLEDEAERFSESCRIMPLQSNSSMPVAGVYGEPYNSFFLLRSRSFETPDGEREVSILHRTRQAVLSWGSDADPDWAHVSVVRIVSVHKATMGTVVVDIGDTVKNMAGATYLVVAANFDVASDGTISVAAFGMPPDSWHFAYSHWKAYKTLFLWRFSPDGTILDRQEYGMNYVKSAGDTVSMKGVHFFPCIEFDSVSWSQTSGPSVALFLDGNDASFSYSGPFWDDDDEFRGKRFSFVVRAFKDGAVVGTRTAWAEVLDEYGYGTEEMTNHVPLHPTVAVSGANIWCNVENELLDHVGITTTAGVFYDSDPSSGEVKSTPMDEPEDWVSLGAEVTYMAPGVPAEPVSVDPTVWPEECSYGETQCGPTSWDGTQCVPTDATRYCHGGGSVGIAYTGPGDDPFGDEEASIEFACSVEYDPSMEDGCHADIVKLGYYGCYIDTGFPTTRYFTDRQYLNLFAYYDRHGGGWVNYGITRESKRTRTDRSEADPEASYDYGMGIFYSGGYDDIRVDSTWKLLRNGVVAATRDETSSERWEHYLLVDWARVTEDPDTGDDVWPAPILPLWGESSRDLMDDAPSFLPSDRFFWHVSRSDGWGIGEESEGVYDQESLDGDRTVSRKDVGSGWESADVPRYVSPTGIDYDRHWTFGSYASRVFCDTDEDPPFETFMTELLSRHNATRAAAGEDPLTLDGSLCRAAQLHANDMAEHSLHSHLGSNGRTLQDRYNIVGVTYNDGAENIQTQSNLSGEWPGEKNNAEAVDLAHQSWVDSPAHYANMVDSAYGRVGFGLAYESGRDLTHWVANFAD